MKILCIGEIMLELAEVEKGLYQRNFAGDTFNLAYYLHAASRGIHEIDYLTAVGQDAMSKECINFMAQKGIGVEQCQQNPAKTLGLFLLSNTADGEKQYHYWRGQSAARALFKQPHDLKNYAFICLSGITAAITEHPDILLSSLQQAKQMGAKIVYDFNHRRQLWHAEPAANFAHKILPLCAFVKISAEELGWLYTNTTMQALTSRYPHSEWVLTQGGLQSEVYQAGQLLQQTSFEPLSVVVDSSAAGDSFFAAYLAARLAGKNWAAALSNGHQVACQVIQTKGSITQIDTTSLCS